MKTKTSFPLFSFGDYFPLTFPKQERFKTHDTIEEERESTTEDFSFAVIVSLHYGWQLRRLIVSACSVYLSVLFLCIHFPESLCCPCLYVISHGTELSCKVLQISAQVLQMHLSPSALFVVTTIETCT